MSIVFRFSGWADGLVCESAGQMQQHVQEAEVQLAADALFWEEVRTCELPAVKLQVLAVITNLIALAGEPACGAQDGAIS